MIVLIHGRDTKDRLVCVDRSHLFVVGTIVDVQHPHVSGVVFRKSHAVYGRRGRFLLLQNGDSQQQTGKDHSHALNQFHPKPPKCMLGRSTADSRAFERLLKIVVREFAMQRNGRELTFGQRCKRLTVLWIADVLTCSYRCPMMSTVELSVALVAPPAEKQQDARCSLWTERGVGTKSHFNRGRPH
jgi:hypothetical protein